MGIGQLISGLVIVILLGVVFFNIGQSLLAPGELHDGSRFTGTAQQARIALGLGGAIFAFGLFAAIAGLVHVTTGRRIPYIGTVSVALVAAIFAAAWAVLPALR